MYLINSIVPVFQLFMDGNDGGHMSGFGTWGNSLFMLFGGLIWLAVIGVLIFLAVPYLRHQSPGGGSKSALDILKERYAKGEIDKKEFEEKKKDLEQ